MADRMAAEISIGGKIPASLVPDLCAVIADDHVCLDWGDRRFEPGSAKELMEATQELGTAENPVQLLWLCDDEARWGEFDSLEEFLVQHGIAFTRRSAGKYEYDAELVEYRPGMQSPCVIYLDLSGNPTVLASELSPAVASLAVALEHLEKGPAETVAESVREAHRLLHNQLPPEVPPLETFEIEQAETNKEEHLGE